MIVTIVVCVLGVVAVLIVVVFVVTSLWRNPHLAHALWFLVLLKLITPPLVR